MISSETPSPKNIDEAVVDEFAPYDDLVRKTFTRISVEDNIPITELLFEGKYSQRYEK